MLERTISTAIGFLWGWIIGKLLGLLLIIFVVYLAIIYGKESEAHKADRIENEKHWQTTQDEQSGHAFGDGWYTVGEINRWGLRKGTPIKVVQGIAQTADHVILGPVNP